MKPYTITKNTIGHVEIKDDATWSVACLYAIDGQSNMLNVEYVLGELESQEESLSDGETQLLAICKEAESLGLPDLAIH